MYKMILLPHICQVNRAFVCKFKMHNIRMCQKTAHSVTENEELASYQIDNLSMNWEKAKPFEEIPGDKAYPIIGNMWPFLPIIGKHSFLQVHNYNLEKYQQYGKIVKIVPGINNKKAVLLFDSRDFQTVFHHEGRYPMRPGMEALKVYQKRRSNLFRNTSLFTINKRKWYEFRSKVQQHLMRPKSIESYIPKMDSTADMMISHMKRLQDKNGEIPNFLNELYKWALESVALIAMDTNLGCLQQFLHPDSEQQKLINATEDIVTSIFSLNFGPPIWKYFPTPTWKRFERALDVFTEVAIKYVNEALEKIKDDAIDDKDIGILETLLQKPDFDYQDAIAMIIDILNAGIDTTAHAVGFTLYHLAKNKNEQEKVYKEISEIIKSKNHLINATNLRKIPYLRACFKESMRLHPVISGTNRNLNHDIVLSNYRIPAGVSCIMANMVACRLEKNFHQADKFIPERWLKPNSDNYNPFLVLPFGFGPRMCIGRRIAEQEIFILLIKIIYNFRIEYNHEDIDCITRLVNMPNQPLRFQFFERY